MDEWNQDSIVEKWVQESDKTIMPLPSLEFEPNLLISKVRKHYMDYLIKLLSENYEYNQKLPNKNIYLPSAIWRCAKKIEMSAVQASMVVDLYRRSITDAIRDLKKATQKGSLYRKLYECLHYAPKNEKKIQANLSGSKDCNCQCSCNQRKKVKRILETSTDLSKNILDNNNISELIPSNGFVQMQTVESNPNHNNSSPNMLADTSDTEIIRQLDKIFEGVENDDELFDRVLCAVESSNECTVPSNNENLQLPLIAYQENPSERTLDERLALISGMLETTTQTETIPQEPVQYNPKKPRPTKWLCEEYFQKVKLYELLDQIRDCDRNKFARVRERLYHLFGDDIVDEGIVSPLDENPDFVISCKERIAPWVVKILTPCYVNGRIRGKNLFKTLAKYLIKLIYQCSKYPQEYEIRSFIEDFLKSHQIIRCEADFKQFRIDNLCT